MTIKENSRYNCNLRSNNRLLFETASIKSKKTLGERSFKMVALSLVWNQTKPRENPAEYVIARPNTGQIGSATHGGSGNVTTTTQHPSHYGIQQLYGHSEYPSRSGSYPSQPARHVTYPTEAAYPSSFRYSYNSSQNGRQAPCLSFIGQRNVAATAPPPPGDASVSKEMKEFAACFPCFVVHSKSERSVLALK